MGYSYFESIRNIDPIEINSIYQSNIIENIYSRLIEYDNAGQIVCSLCSSFTIMNESIVFHFDNSNYTIDGHSLGELDAKVSLQRIYNSQTNTHGSLRYYLKKGDQEQFESTPGALIINVKKAAWVPFVLNLLASMDFSIIPTSSLDFNSNKIVDYKNTTGRYYVKSFDDKGNIVLGANTKNSRYNNKMIDEIVFVPTKSGEANINFADNKIDMIDPTYYAYESDIQSILDLLPNASIHKTLNIGLTTLVFSNNALLKFSSKERLSAAKIIKNWFLEKTAKIYGAEETDQYFQSFGQGFISSEQRDLLKKELEAANSISRPLRMTFGVTEKYRAWLEGYNFPDFIQVRFYKTYPGFLEEKERPDIYLMTVDSSFDEDISALSYLFSQGIFSLGKDNGADWIVNYMNLPEKSDRIALLRDLHYKMLSSVKVFPLLARPYIAIARSNFLVDFPKIYAGTPMWRVWTR